MDDNDFQGPTGRNALPLYSPMHPPIRHFLTEAQRSQVCESLASGSSYEAAADCSGATVEAIRTEETVDPSFAQRTSQAHLQSEVNLLKSLTGATSDSKQWRAAAWLLERLYPDRYARRKPNTLPLKEHEQRVQQISDLIKSIAPDDVWQMLKRHLDELLNPAPVDSNQRTSDENSIEQSESSTPRETSKGSPLVEESDSPDRREVALNPPAA